MKHLFLITLLFVSVFSTGPIMAQEDSTSVDSTEQVTTTTSEVEPAQYDQNEDLEPIEDQIVPDSAGDAPTLEELTNMAIPIMSIAGIVITFLTGFFPNFTFFKDDRKRDLATKGLVAAIIVGIVAVQFGLADTWMVVVAFILQSFGYDKVLQPLGMKTKSSAPAKA